MALAGVMSLHLHRAEAGAVAPHYMLEAWQRKDVLTLLVGTWYKLTQGQDALCVDGSSPHRVLRVDSNTLQGSRTLMSLTTAPPFLFNFNFFNKKFTWALLQKPSI